MDGPPCVCSCDEISPVPPNPLLPQVFIFIGETLLSMNWAIVADILLVSRWAIQGLVQRLLGAGSGCGRPDLP